MDCKNKGENVQKPGTVGGKKRGMNDSEGSVRHSKKRKYVLLGGNWGQRDGMKECGLNRKLDDSTSMESMITTSEAGTGPLEDQKDLGKNLSSTEERVQEPGGGILLGNEVQSMVGDEARYYR